MLPVRIPEGRLRSVTKPATLAQKRSGPVGSPALAPHAQRSGADAEADEDPARAEAQPCLQVVFSSSCVAGATYRSSGGRAAALRPSHITEWPQRTDKLCLHCGQACPSVPLAVVARHDADGYHLLRFFCRPCCQLGFIAAGNFDNGEQMKAWTLTLNAEVFGLRGDFYAAPPRTFAEPYAADGGMTWPEFYGEDAPRTVVKSVLCAPLITFNMMAECLERGAAARHASEGADGSSSSAPPGAAARKIAVPVSTHKQPIYITFLAARALAAQGQAAAAADLDALVAEACKDVSSSGGSSAAGVCSGSSRSGAASAPSAAAAAVAAPSAVPSRDADAASTATPPCVGADTCAVLDAAASAVNKTDAEHVAKTASAGPKRIRAAAAARGRHVLSASSSVTQVSLDSSTSEMSSPSTQLCGPPDAHRAVPVKGKTKLRAESARINAPPPRASTAGPAHEHHSCAESPSTQSAPESPESVGANAESAEERKRKKRREARQRQRLAQRLSALQTAQSAVATVPEPAHAPTQNVEAAPHEFTWQESARQDPVPPANTLPISREAPKPPRSHKRKRRDVEVAIDNVRGRADSVTVSVAASAVRALPAATGDTICEARGIDVDAREPLTTETASSTAESQDAEVAVTQCMRDVEAGSVADVEANAVVDVEANAVVDVEAKACAETTPRRKSVPKPRAKRNAKRPRRDPRRRGSETAPAHVECVEVGPTIASQDCAAQDFEQTLAVADADSVEAPADDSEAVKSANASFTCPIRTQQTEDPQAQASERKAALADIKQAEVSPTMLFAAVAAPASSVSSASSAAATPQRSLLQSLLKRSASGR